MAKNHEWNERMSETKLLTALREDPSRIYKKIDQGTEGECWPWWGYLKKDYGYLYYHRNYYLVHRLVWMLAHDKVPGAGKVISHTCKLRCCCNPAHLVERDSNMTALQEASHATRKLTDEQVQEVRDEHNRGVSVYRLAHLYHTSLTAMQRIITGATYRDITHRDPDLPQN